jgi:hypothetical protein
MSPIPLSHDIFRATRPAATRSEYGGHHRDPHHAQPDAHADGHAHAHPHAHALPHAHADDSGHGDGLAGG